MQTVTSSLTAPIVVLRQPWVNPYLKKVVEWLSPPWTRLYTANDLRSEPNRYEPDLMDAISELHRDGVIDLFHFARTTDKDITAMYVLRHPRNPKHLCTERLLSRPPSNFRYLKYIPYDPQTMGKG